MHVLYYWRSPSPHDPAAHKGPMTNAASWILAQLPAMRRKRLENPLLMGEELKLSVILACIAGMRQEKHAAAQDSPCARHVHHKGGQHRPASCRT
jgi:hypothetical protein